MEEDWSDIVTEYKLNTYHINISKNAYEIILKIYDYIKLKKPNIINKSMIFFHKFYLYNLINKSNIDYDNGNLIYICISCYYLVTKSLNYLMRFDDIIDILYKYNLLKNDNNNNIKEKHKEIIFEYEFEILESLGFDLNNYELPYKYISFLFDKIINKYITDISNLKNIKEYYLALINYSYIFPHFLKFNTLTIVLSLLKILFIIKNIKINFNQILSEFKEFEYNFIQKELDNCYNLIYLFLFKEKIDIKNNNNKTNNSINMDVLLKINVVNLNMKSYSNAIIKKK